MSRGQQEYQARPRTHPIVGSSVLHNSAYLHATGEAIYTFDIPTPNDDLHSALVLSTEPYAKIISIDTTKAEHTPGFKGFINYLDVPGSQWTGDVVNDEEVFPSSTVYCVGTIIRLVIADTEVHAHIASKLIDIKYECLHPVIYARLIKQSNMNHI